MEFTNEIFFNKPLTANETVIITYFGKLYREHSQDVSIVYGFGDNWEFTSEAPMKEIENGFEVTITMRDFNTFNFCFKNTYGIWDNNFGFNYISSIEPQTFQNNSTLDSQLTNDNSVQEQENSNENENNENDVENEIDINEDANDEDSSNETNAAENFTNDSQNEIEAVFSSLLDSILNNVNSTSETINVDEMEGFGLQSVDEIKEENFVNCDEIFNEFYNELATVPTQTDENLELKQTVEYSDDLEALFDKLFSTTTGQVKDNIQEITIEGGKELISSSDGKTELTSLSDLEVNFEKYSTEELDALMDNILNSITTCDSSEIELSSPTQSKAETHEAVSTNNLEQTKVEATDEVVGLPAIPEQEDWFEKFLDSSYAFIKKVGITCKKIGALIKVKAQEYGIIKEK